MHDPLLGYWDEEPKKAHRFQCLVVARSKLLEMQLCTAEVMVKTRCTVGRKGEGGFM